MDIAGSALGEGLIGSDYGTEVSDTCKGKRPKVLHVWNLGQASHHSCDGMSDGMSDGEGGGDEIAADGLSGSLLPGYWPWTG